MALNILTDCKLIDAITANIHMTGYTYLYYRYYMHIYIFIKTLVPNVSD